MRSGCGRWRRWLAGARELAHPPKIWPGSRRAPVATVTAVTTVTSIDVDGGAAVYSISGGADAARFTIDASTGVLSFVAAPNFDLDACRAWFTEQGVAKFKTPERVIVVDELPLLGSGKPDRAALRARLAPR